MYFCSSGRECRKQFEKIALKGFVGLRGKRGLNAGGGIFVVQQAQTAGCDTPLLDFRGGQPFAIVTEWVLKAVPLRCYRATRAIPEERFL